MEEDGYRAYSFTFSIHQAYFMSGIRWIWIVVGVFLLAMSMSSCGENYVFDEEKIIDQAGWSYQDSVSFAVDIKDTTKVYCLYLDIVHDTEYSNQNLYVYINTEFPNGERPGKRLSINLSENSGRWYGDCGKTNCVLRANLQPRAFFNELGKHTFTVKQYMRTDPLQGIESLSLKILDLGEERK